jgi:hypothetical protein
MSQHANVHQWPTGTNRHSGPNHHAGTFELTNTNQHSAFAQHPGG